MVAQMHTLAVSQSARRYQTIIVNNVAELKFTTNYIAKTRLLLNYLNVCTKNIYNTYMNAPYIKIYSKFFINNWVNIYYEICVFYNQ